MGRNGVPRAVAVFSTNMSSLGGGGGGDMEVLGFDVIVGGMSHSSGSARVMCVVCVVCGCFSLLFPKRMTRVRRVK